MVSWWIRLNEELNSCKSAIFLTLTYSDQNLLYHENDKVGSVYKSEIQSFIKRLRKNKSFRYYCVGEYGTKSQRPHYHLICFGLSKDDHDIIKEAWSLDGKLIGHIYIGDVNEASIMYVCKYHINRGRYPHGCMPSFTLMSTKPAIGLKFLENNKYYEGDIDRIFYAKFGVKFTLPRIYKERLYNKEELERFKIANTVKYWEEAPNTLEEIKAFWSVVETQIRVFKQKSKLNQKL